MIGRICREQVRPCRLADQGHFNRGIRHNGLISEIR